MLKTEKLESRTYQEVISASARDSNTLVVLPTGLGKTVIAAMVASQKLPDGKTLFLAPTKPLVQQHKKSFKDFIEIPEDQLQVMTGETRPAKREKLWQEKQAFFATPQIVENDLISDNIPIEEFSLIIFDEAHRATGDYAYNFISEKMHSQRLALTASPGGEKEKIMNVADNLEITNFEIRTEDDPDVEPYIEDKEVDWKRVSLDNRFQTANKKMEDARRTQLKKLKKMGQIDSVNQQKTDLLNLRGKISSKLSSTDDPKLYSAISHVATALKISQAIELLQTQGVSQAYDYIHGLENDDSKAAGRALEDEDFQKAKSLIEYLRKKGEEHPKIDKTRELLSNLSGEEKAIVFTEYRATADKIVEELEEEGLNPVKFIGQQGDEGMSQKEQIETLGEFDSGEHNVLVSTSIGEEGLDIPSVDKVIFYEPVPSAVRDIQRAGRTGRQEEGEVVVLIAEDTRDEGYYWSAHHKKKNMKKTLKELKNSDEIQEKQQKKLENFKKVKDGDKQENADEEDEEDSIEIVADDRENSIAKELSRDDLKIDKKRLDVADFIVSDRTAIERKRTDDFVDSIIDNRLFNQLQELQQFDNPVIIIEGENLYTHRDIDPKAIRGAISSLALDYQIPTIWTDDEEDTVETLKALARREQEDENREVQVRGTKSGMTDEETLEFIVSGIPDINSKIAERLLEEFGTVRDIFTASPSDLEKVEGIGEKTADKIVDYATRNYK